MSAREELSSQVRSLVWSGEYNVADMAIVLRSSFGELDEVDKLWLYNFIISEFQSKRLAEESWPQVTDFDRIERAFQALDAQGIIALHRAGYTHSDGHEEVSMAYENAGGRSSEYTGYCFYTEQDQESTLTRDELYIAFGHLSGDEKKGVIIGRKLRSALESEGFVIDWDGTFSSRLIVKAFLWQRRSPL
jgi:hypothetical protein